MTTPSVGMELFVFCILKAVAVVLFICVEERCVVSMYVFLHSHPTECDSHASTHISALPQEVLVRLFRYLGPEDLCRCSQVCRTWAEVVKTGSLWRHLYPVRWARGESLTSVQWCEIILALSISETVIMSPFSETH